MNKAARAFWNDFCKEHNISPETPYVAWSFGYGKDMADELANLVKKGIKTATTSAYELYKEDEDIPQEGEYNIILDGSDRPVCVTQTKVVYILPYNQISPGHAWHEGEGDRSYNCWRRLHDCFFAMEYKAAGKIFHEEAPMCCEIFEIIE